jgi:hypothetical protein
MMIFKVLKSEVFLFILLVASSNRASTARRFPSAGCSYIIPGSQVSPTLPAVERILPTAIDVLKWELDHCDMTYGGSYGDRNRNITAIGYMYTQAIEFDPDGTAQALRRRALDEGSDYENIFIHFSADTAFFLTNPHHSSETSFGGIPWVMGYTSSSGHAGFWLYQTPPWNSVSAWAGWESGGAFYCYQFERFDQLNFSLDTRGGNGTLLLEYPSAVEASAVAAEGVEVPRLVSEWSTLTLLEDTTNSLQQSGILRWKPPSNWKLASTHDGSGNTYGGTGPYMGQISLQQGGVAYVVRISWIPASAKETLPTLADVSLRRWITEVIPGDPSVQTVPGWAAENDGNGDGYVDDDEYASRVITSASARFRHEARAIPLGRMWSSHSSWCRVNPWSPDLGLWLGDYLKQEWANEGQSGAYNDDLLKLVGPNEYVLFNGGQLVEANYTVNSTEYEDLFQTQFAKMLAIIANRTKALITGNISGKNLFMSKLTRPFLEHLKGLLREDYLTSGMGMTGYFGLQKAWDTFALGARGIVSIVQCQMKSARVEKLGKTQANYQGDQEACLALFYLVNIPELTFLNVWGNNFNYGSDNTGTWNFFVDGVPKNWAYMPTDAMEFDIGVPSNRMPEGAEPLQYMVATKSPLSDYTIIGRANETTLHHAEISDDGDLSILPSYLYYAWRDADHPYVPGAPLEAAVARQYTNGLVVFRTDLFGGNLAWLNSNDTLMVHLNGTYRRITMEMNKTLGRSTAVLGPLISTVELGPYEGAIFQLAEVPTSHPTLSDFVEVYAKVSGITVFATTPPTSVDVESLRSSFAAQLNVNVDDVVDLEVTSTEVRRKLMSYVWVVSFLVQTSTRIAVSSWILFARNALSEDDFAVSLANDLGGNGISVQTSNLGLVSVSSESPTIAPKFEPAPTSMPVLGTPARDSFDFAGQHLLIIFFSTSAVFTVLVVTAARSRIRNLLCSTEQSDDSKIERAPEHSDDSPDKELSSNFALPSTGINCQGTGDTTRQIGVKI